MCFSTPKIPDPAPIAPAISDPSKLAGEAETGARDSERKKKAAGLGKSDTILTGSSDMSAAPGSKKTLLGQ